MPDKRKQTTHGAGHMVYHDEPKASPPATIIHKNPEQHDTGFHSGTFQDRGFHSDAFKVRDRGR